MIVFYNFKNPVYNEQWCLLRIENSRFRRKCFCGLIDLWADWMADFIEQLSIVSYVLIMVILSNLFWNGDNLLWIRLEFDKSCWLIDPSCLPLLRPTPPSHPPTQRRVRVRLSYGDCRLIGLLSLNLCRAPYLHVNFAYLVWSDLYTVVSREYLLPQNYCKISPEEHREVSTQAVNKRRQLDFTNSTTFRTIISWTFSVLLRMFLRAKLLY